MKQTLTNFLIKFTLYAIPLFLLWAVIGPIYTTFLIKITQPFLQLITSLKNNILFIQLETLKVGIDFTTAHLLDFNLVPLLAIIFAVSAEKKQKIKIGLTILLSTIVYHALITFSRITSIFDSNTIWKVIPTTQVMIYPIILFLAWYLILESNPKSKTVLE